MKWKVDSKFSDFLDNFENKDGRGSWWSVGKHAYIIPLSLSRSLICPLSQHHRFWPSCSFEHLSLWFQINKTGNEWILDEIFSVGGRLRLIKACIIDQIENLLYLWNQTVIISSPLLPPLSLRTVNCKKAKD